MGCFGVLQGCLVRRRRWVCRPFSSGTAVLFSSRYQSPGSTTFIVFVGCCLRIVFIPLSKSGQYNSKIAQLLIVPIVFSSRYQSPGSTTLDEMLGAVMLACFHPVIKVRAVQLYPCNRLLCKRNFGCLRRGF